MSTTAFSKMTLASAWAAWGADGSSSAGLDFLQRVGAWLEGTAAQLRRDQWRAGSKRPTSNELQDRLRHHLEIVVQDGQSNYLEGLELARRGVMEEIRGAAAS